MMPDVAGTAAAGSTLELSRGCNGVQGATATLALTAALAM
jgi:hypothetical protein